jgi:peptide-methionine (S)-S-oxide reductase
LPVIRVTFYPEEVRPRVLLRQSFFLSIICDYERDIAMNQSTNPTPGAAGKEVATIAGGCFWCVEAVFDDLKGVESVESGYSGGRLPNPTYKQICTGATGHAEAIRVTFDPSVISYRELLDVFFTIHDPTTPNRQGNDVGTQYRSAIFYHSPEQKAIAEQPINDLSGDKIWRDPIVTQVVPDEPFYVAENYHQEYFRQHGYEPYCQAVVAPKMRKFREKFKAKLK